MVIRTASISDLEKIALCHKSAFPKSLSTAFGTNYLKKMLEWYLIDSSRFLFYAEENEKCVGYCGGMINPGDLKMGSASGMTQYSLSRAVSSFFTRPYLIFHPEVTNKYPFIAKNLIYRAKTFFDKNTHHSPKNEKYPEPRVGLIVIGVSSIHREKGIGSFLLQEFEKVVLKRGFKQMYLSVLKDNERAIKAYEKNGWLKKNEVGNSLNMYKNIK